MTVIAIIPSRMGSKRLPRKNALEIEAGVSLVQQAIDCARYSGVIDETFVLTDDDSLFFTGAHRIPEPPTYAADAADISAAVMWGTKRVEDERGWHPQYVVTLQPAVLARSPLIVKRMVQGCIRSGGVCRGMVTAARTVPWQWAVRDGRADNGWYPDAYPRSAAAPHHFAEINAVQIAHIDAVREGARWGLPMMLAELPSWAAALDIDEPEDLATARDMWTWAKYRLETWQPTLHAVATINGHHT